MFNINAFEYQELLALRWNIDWREDGRTHTHAYTHAAADGVWGACRWRWPVCLSGSVMNVVWPVSWQCKARTKNESARSRLTKIACYRDPQPPNTNATPDSAKQTKWIIPYTFLWACDDGVWLENLPQRGIPPPRTNDISMSNAYAYEKLVMCTSRRVPVWQARRSPKNPFRRTTACIFSL